MRTEEGGGGVAGVSRSEKGLLVVVQADLFDPFAQAVAFLALNEVEVLHEQRAEEHRVAQVAERRQQPVQPRADGALDEQADKRAGHRERNREHAGQQGRDKVDRTPNVWPQ